MDRALQVVDDRRTRLAWVGAGLLGLLGLGAWSLFEPIGFPGPSPEQDYPRMSYRPVLTSGNDLGHGGALQSVWTPILFSLPTRAGFSSLFLEKPGNALPPAGLPEEPSLHRPARTEQNWEAYKTEPAQTDISAQIRYARRRMPAPPASAPVSDGVAQQVSPGGAAAPAIRWGGGLSAAIMLESTLNLQGLGGGVRDVVLAVDVSEEGLFDRVFVEQSSGDVEWDNRVVGRVKQWRAVPASVRRHGRVDVQTGTYGMPDVKDAEVLP